MTNIGTYVLSAESPGTGGSGWDSPTLCSDTGASYSYNGGTSMSAPLTAGLGGVVMQDLVTRLGISQPNPSLVKALLINGAVSLNPDNCNYSFAVDQTSIAQGWGMANALNSMYGPGGNQSSRNIAFENEQNSVGTGGEYATPQALTEEQQGGNPSRARSLLDHTWTFDVVSGTSYQFYLDAYHSPNSEGDDFAFSYSTDNSTYHPMVTVTDTADGGAPQAFEFPADVSGTLYVRVQDTDETRGNGELDTVFVDFMAITTVTDGADIFPPAAPSGLVATPGDGTVSLDWADNGESDLQGYNVYRSTTSGGAYTQLNGSLLAVNSYADSSVTNGTQYCYVVTAVDTTGNQSGFSAEVSAIPSEPDSVTSVHVQSVETSTVNIGQGNKRGQAVVTVLNNLGDPVSGATVSGEFSGSINEPASGVTDDTGTATMQTEGTAKGGVTVSFCVSDVTAESLTYVAGDNGAAVTSCGS